MSVVTVTATASGVCMLPGGGVSTFGSSSASAAMSSPSTSMATPGSTPASSSAAQTSAASSAASSSAAGGSGSVPTAVINDFSTIIAQVGSLNSAVVEFRTNTNALGAVVQGNNAVVSAVSMAISDANAAGPANEAGASSVISAVNALITGNPGIETLISNLEAASAEFNSYGPAIIAQVSGDLVTQSSLASSLAGILSSKAPTDQQATASSLGAEIGAIFSSAIAFYS